jgi:hypothetical protein
MTAHSDAVALLHECQQLIRDAWADVPLSPERIAALKSQIELHVLDAEEAEQQSIRQVLAEPLVWLERGM